MLVFTANSDRSAAFEDLVKRFSEEREKQMQETAEKIKQRKLEEWFATKSTDACCENKGCDDPCCGGCVDDPNACEPQRLTIGQEYHYYEEDTNEYKCELLLPGATASDVSVTVNDDLELLVEVNVNRRGLIYSFKSCPVIDVREYEDNITANVHNGLLTITLRPLIKKTQTRKISITAVER